MPYGEKLKGKGWLLQKEKAFMGEEGSQLNILGLGFSRKKG